MLSVKSIDCGQLQPASADVEACRADVSLHNVLYSTKKLRVLYLDVSTR